jgi:4-alpha-glucanotransferase
MKFGNLDHYYTGIAIPISALRSDQSCGVGDFLDLLVLANFCKEAGFEVIQILPINDTGFQSSPYSALSAFALHPLYVRLEAIPEASDFDGELQAAKIKYENLPRLKYQDVLNFKLDLLSRIFLKNKKTILADKDLNKWVTANPWVKAYSVFYFLKKQYAFCHWKSWPKLQNPTSKDIEDFWNEQYEECVFYAWIQRVLESQLHGVAQAMEKMGVYLKGDLPILMNEDSVDVWASRGYFHLDSKAGAPPDMYSSVGQNWDFPIYDWDAMKKDDYTFWRSRLKQADKFYHAYRIDHVLGFFRIYSIPNVDNTGRLGYFFPAKYITIEDLHKAGFDKGRIRWLAVPHIPLSEIQEHFNTKTDHIINTYLVRIGNEDLFNLKPEYEGERLIEALEEDDKIKAMLVRWHRDRALLEVSPGKYHRVWTYGDSTAYKSLLDKEKQVFEHLVKESEKASEHLWEKHGTELLSKMQKTTGMLMCAEDLGVVPPCVPKVLKKLGILSLKIERWTRKWEEPETPYIPVKEFPLLSVCTPSVHDTSTLKGWWDFELSDEEKEKYVKHMQFSGSQYKEFSVELAEHIFKYLLETNSLLCMFPIQELFSLTTELRISNPEEERINVPATISDLNWTYRIYSSLEFLMNYEKFASFLKKSIKKRKGRILDKKH